MNVKERKELVLSMERIIRSLNDEELLVPWLICGVADGDLNEDSTWEDVDDFYIEDEFSSIMEEFCVIMKRATSDGLHGVLYCNGVIS